MSYALEVKGADISISKHFDMFHKVKFDCIVWQWLLVLFVSDSFKGLAIVQKQPQANFPLSVIYLPKKSQDSLTQFLMVHALKERLNCNTINTS